jgi:uncharacterized protein YerC/transposase-like protein
MANGRVTVNDAALVPSGITARTEAVGIWKLVKNGALSVPAARELIGSSTAFRLQVLIAFDALCIHPGQVAEITPELRSEVLRLLRLNLSQQKVAQTLGIGTPLIGRIAREAGICFQKIGRGRRLSPALKEKIMAAVKSGERSSEIQKAFGVDYDTTIAFRRRLGDHSDRRHLTKLSAEQIDLAEANLAKGTTWRDTAAQLGVSLATLQKSTPYRKGTRGYKLPPIVKDEILTALKAGQRQVDICKATGVSERTVRRIRRDAGLSEVVHRLSSVERQGILEGIRAGRPNREIAAEFSCDRTRVWQIRVEQGNARQRS